MLKAVIIDDEKMVRRVLRHLVAGSEYPVEIIGEAESIEEGYRVLTRLRPDVVFLDMQLSDGNGFELLDKFQSVDFELIIITAYQEYAIKAFKFSAIDYLLKPIDPTELSEALEKVSKTRANTESNQKFEVLLSYSPTRTEKSEKKIVLKTLEETRVVAIDEIIRCESHSNQTTFFLSDGSLPITVSRTLKEYEELLGDYGFIRCHQSHLINERFIQKRCRIPRPQLILKNGDTIPVSHRKRKLTE